MRARAASIVGAAALFAACAAPDPPPSAPAASASPLRADGGAAGDPVRLREDALRRARVWREPDQPVASVDLAANPAGPDSFPTDADVPCTFLPNRTSGTSPKFECALPSGEEVKVKYGHNAAEVFAEVAATRLLSALGFGADRMYIVRTVRCRGCPVYPYPKIGVLDDVRRDQDREVTFDLAAIERKMPGRTIKAGAIEGWSWYELDRIDPAAGGSSRAEVDALRLMGVFLNHWDNKGANQRLVCLSDGDSLRCAQPFALLQDVGQTFGPRGVNLDGWRGTRIWADAATCRVSMKDLPYGGATFGEAHITEGGRLFLGDLLRRLSHAQIAALFRGARFPEFARQTPAGRDVENWAAAFEDRVRQIVDRSPCPANIPG
jgi:hypothetical protein